MTADQPAGAPAPSRLGDVPGEVVDPAPAPAPMTQAIAETTASLEIATLELPPALVIGVPDDPRTGEPSRPVVVMIAAVLCWLAVAVTGASVLWVYWDAVSRFAQASWLMAQFETAPGSLQRVLLAIAVTLVALVVGTANAIVGHYAWTGYRWTRIAGLFSGAATISVLLLNQLALAAIPLALAGSGLLWLPAVGRFFTAWQAHRHPPEIFANPLTQVRYGPVRRFG